VAAASLGQNRCDREPPLFSLFFREKTAAPIGESRGIPRFLVIAAAK